MTFLLRTTLLALVLLGLAPEALAQEASAQDGEAVTITRTPSGFVIAAPGDAPVGDAPVALLTQVGDNGWSLQTLASGDVPSEIAARPVGTVVMGLTADRRADLDRRLAATERSAAAYDAASTRYQAVLGARSRITMGEVARETHVRYKVTGRIARAASDALVRLSESTALASVETIMDADGKTRVDAEFRFDSVEDWAEWKAHPETDALLAPLAEKKTRLQTRQR